MTLPLVDRLPSLLSLLYVEAAVRHGNFTYAARELHVSQSAVSRQIRALEDALHKPLFRRTPSGAEPLPEAIALAHSVQHGLEHIATCLDTHFSPTQPHTTPHTEITLGIIPSLTSHWLIARLAQFHRAHPNTTLRPLAGLQFHDFTRNEADAGLRYGLGHYPNHDCIQLCKEHLVAVCTPSLWSAHNPPPNSLQGLPILEAWTPKSPRGVRPALWWAQTTGVSLGAPIITFNRQAIAITAALEGQGVAIVPWQMVRDAIDRGHLIQPVPHRAPDHMAYYLVWHPDHCDRAKVDLLHIWFAEQFQP